MRIHFASCLLAVAQAAERNFGSPWYYGSFGHHGSGFVDQNWMPNDITFTPQGYYNPTYGGYMVVSFPDTSTLMVLTSATTETRHLTLTIPSLIGSTLQMIPTTIVVTPKIVKRSIKFSWSMSLQSKFPGLS